MNHDFMLRVQSHLRVDAGLESTYEYPGFISIPCGTFLLQWGTANETWGADIDVLVGNTVESTGECIVTILPSNCDDPSLVGLTIAEKTTEFDQAHYNKQAQEADTAPNGGAAPSLR